MEGQTMPISPGVILLLKKINWAGCGVCFPVIIAYPFCGNHPER
jgi:hypothetical protein